MRSRTLLPVSLAVLAAVSFLAAGCGGSSSTTASTAGRNKLLAYSDCMRSHGVPNFPDPRPGGPSVVPNWINPQAPAFLFAQKACSKFLGSGGSSASDHESEKVALLNLARCMRAHGLTSFPDPTTSPPPAPPPASHTGNAVGIAGVYLVFPPQSPALKRAEAKCGFRAP